MKRRHLLVATLALAACGSKSSSTIPMQFGLGQTCELGASAPDGGGTISVVSSPALDCPSRICLLPAGDTGNPQGTGALCTISCRSNTDCVSGQLGPSQNPSDTHCENGFVCMVPMTVGPFACQKLCVCRDFVTEPPGGFQTPAVCAQGG